MPKHASVNSLKNFPALSNKRFTFADGLRGFAALWVVLFHLSEGHHIDQLKAMLPTILSSALFDFGVFSIAIFFVLSGFVMMLTVQNTRINAPNAGIFVLRRLIRITPPYYLAITISLIFALIKAHMLKQTEPITDTLTLLAHATYLQGILSIPHINIVYWTLCIEVQLYLSFALLLLFADLIIHRLGYAKGQELVMMFASLIALCYPLGIISNSLWTASFLGFWFSFLAGVLACLSWLGGGNIRVFTLIYYGILIFASYHFHSSFIMVVVITASSLLIAGITQKMHIWLSWSWIQFLGLTSYSLYLLHNPITGASFRAIHKLFPENGLNVEIMGSILTLLLCFLSAWLAYLFVERPSIAWSHYFSSKKTGVSKS